MKSSFPVLADPSSISITLLKIKRALFQHPHKLFSTKATCWSNINFILIFSRLGTSIMSLWDWRRRGFITKWPEFWFSGCYFILLSTLNFRINNKSAGSSLFSSRNLQKILACFPTLRIWIGFSVLAFNGWAIRGKNRNLQRCLCPNKSLVDKKNAKVFDANFVYRGCFQFKAGLTPEMTSIFTINFVLSQ